MPPGDAVQIELDTPDELQVTAPGGGVQIDGAGVDGLTVSVASGQVTVGSAGTTQLTFPDESGTVTPVSGSSVSVPAGAPPLQIRDQDGAPVQIVVPSGSGPVAISDGSSSDVTVTVPAAGSKRTVISSSAGSFGLRVPLGDLELSLQLDGTDGVRLALPASTEAGSHLLALTPAARVEVAASAGPVLVRVENGALHFFFSAGSTVDEQGAMPVD
jgi:hypothetical protein